MSTFDLQSFVANPTLQVFERCRKDELLQIADHYRIPVMRKVSELTLRLWKSVRLAWGIWRRQQVPEKFLEEQEKPVAVPTEVLAVAAIAVPDSTAVNDEVLLPSPGVTSDWTIRLSICWRKGLTSGIALPIVGYGAACEQLKTSMAAARKQTLGWGDRTFSVRMVFSFERPV
ncbi:uncharacterized protein [Chanodichthys erythropterus]|uniref:uncharacterized protein isoform X2 n=1 Tax=Chanodichthys erythropterus TaxID=933992 RepID=UPI00351F2211